MRDATMAGQRLLPVLILGSIGLLVLGVQPVLYGAYIHEGLIGEERLGTLAAAEISAIALGSMVGVALLKRQTAQAVGVIGVVLLVLGNMLPESVPLLLTRAIAGLGCGMVVALAAGKIAQQINVNAASGMFLFLQAISQYAIMQGFAIAAPTASAASVQQALAALAVLGAPLLLIIPRHLAVVDETVTTGVPPPAGWIALAVCALFVGATIGIWAYLGVWLGSVGVPAESISTRLTASLVGQIIGALAAVALGTHGRSGLQVIASGLVIIATVLLLLFAGADGALGWVLMIGFGIAWMVGTPALSGFVLECDPERRSLPYAASAQLFGAAVVPTLVGELLASRGLGLVLATSAALATLAILIVPVGLAVRARRANV